MVILSLAAVIVAVAGSLLAAFRTDIVAMVFAFVAIISAICLGALYSDADERASLADQIESDFGLEVEDPDELPESFTATSELGTLTCSLTSNESFLVCTSPSAGTLTLARGSRL